MKSKKRFLISIAVFVCCMAVLLLSSFAITSAQAEIGTEKTFKVAHITDVHLFLKEFCNEYSPDFKSADNSFNLLYYSEDALRAVLKKVADEDADYLIVSGDLSANGERASHEFVANMLRNAQAEIRQNKPNFQVFVIPGNHDIYNMYAASYMPSESALNQCSTQAEKDNLIKNFTSSNVPTVTLKEFFEIYQGLGYFDESLPNSDLNKGNIEYFFQSDYFYGLTCTNYVDALTTETPTTAEIELYGTDKTALDKASRAGGLSYIAQMDDGFTLVALDSVRFSYVNNSKYEGFGADAAKFGCWGYRTSGNINNNQLLWVEDTLADLDEPTALMATAHHSIVPHTDMEDDVTSGFIVDDFRKVSYFLADLGIKYVLTGHVHENDIAQYVSQKGNILFDIETPSVCAFGCGMRMLELKIEADGKEKLLDSVYSVKALEVDGENVDIVAILNAKSAAIGNLITRKLTPSLLDSLKETVEGLNGKQIVIFNIGQTTVDFINTFIDEFADFDFIKPSINGLEYTFGNTPTKGYKVFDFACDFVNYFLQIDGSCGRVEGGYPIVNFAMDMYRTHLIGAEGAERSESLKAVCEAAESGELTELVIDTLVDWLMPELTLIFDAPIGLSESVEEGVGFDLSAYNSKFAGVSSKDLGKILFNLLKNNDVNSLRTLVFALKDIVNNDSISMLLKTLNSSTISKVLEYTDKIHEDTVLADFVQTELLDKYATHALFVNLGYYVSNILTAFGTDNTSEGTTIQTDNGVMRYVYQTNQLVKFKKVDGAYAYDGAYTYAGALTKAENPSTIEDGRLPSMISIGYGKDVYTQLNFKWFTRVQNGLGASASASSLKYWVDGGSKKTISATNDVIALNIPLIDLGVMYITSAMLDYEMHTVNATFTDVPAGSTIHYQVGSDEYGWSEEYTVKLKEANGEVNVLAMTDIQGSIEHNYVETKKNMQIALETVGNIDFVISAGDNVDKDDNTYQWEWLLNHNSDIFANYTLVTCAGNHENGGNAFVNYLAVPSKAKVTDKNKDESNGYYYSYDIESVHFVVLNTNDLEGNGTLSNAQLKWLKTDLGKVTDKWIVVTMHKGIYTAGSHAFDSDVVALRAQLTPIFAEYGVDIVLQGHDHCYSVCEYIDETGNPTEVDYDDMGNAIDPSGVLYVNLGTMGDKFYNYLYHENVKLKKRTNDGYILATPLASALHSGRLELTNASAFAYLHADSDKITLTTYAIADGESYLLDVLGITKAEKAVVLQGAPKFKVTIDKGFSLCTFTDKDTKDMELCTFYEQTEAGTVYYKGYCVADYLKGDKKCVKIDGEVGLSEGTYVALYSANEPNGEYVALSSAKVVMLGDCSYKLMDTWLFALLVSLGGALIISGVVVCVVLVKRKKKLGAQNAQ